MTSALDAARSSGRANERYRYSSLPSDGTVRLLTLLPGRRGSDVHIQLDNAALDSNPKYEALSYEWGLPGSVEVPNYHDALSNSFWNLNVTIQLQEQVYCWGKAVVVTKNLHTILNHLRSTDRRRVLWIDGICINQEDVNERRDQVLLMRRIYEQASKVLMWIGEAKPGTRRAFGIVRHLAMAYDDRKPNTDRNRVGHLGEVVIDESVLEELKGESWSAVTDVFTRPYFGRVWVVQEIVMSTVADVLCGECPVPWADLYKAMLVIFVLGLVLDKDPHQLPPEALVPNSHAVVQLKSAKEEQTQNRRLWGRVDSIGQVWNSRHGSIHNNTKYPYTLATLANVFLGHEVTDSRDRIYGMLGMANPESTYGQDHPIQPDYTKTVEEVYRAACQWSIRDSGSLSMLDQCDAPATNKLKNLPTWVPDLTSGVRKCRLITDVNTGDEEIGGPLLRPISTYLRDQFQMSFNRGNDVLKVRGQAIDIVSAVSLNCTSMIKHIITMEAFQRFCLDAEPYPTGGTRIEAVWRTFLTNYVSTGPSVRDITEAPAVFGEHFIANMTGNFRYQLGLPDSLTGSMSDINTINEQGNWTLRRMYSEDVKANISILALMAKHPFIRYLYDHGKVGDAEAWEAEFGRREYIAYGDEGRQFVVTEKGYMGLGPRCPPLQYEGDQFVLQRGSYVSKGDVVAVLAGSDKVWYLRRDMDSGPYQIIGHGYVYGVMEGRWYGKEGLPVMEDIELR